MKTHIIALTALASLAVSAFGTPALRLSDGTTTITVLDGDPNDQAPDPGVVYYNGPVGPNWTVNITVGITKPAQGTPSEPFMDLDTTSLSQTAGDLKIDFTETGFTAASGTFFAQAGGTTDGSVEFKYYLDSGNAAFGTSVLLADLPNNVDVYAPSSNGTFSITAPYSMTIEALIHHTGRGLTSFDEALQLTPSCPPCVDPIFGLGPDTTTVFQLGSGKIDITGPPGGIIGDIWDNKGKLSITGSEFVTGTIHLGVGATFANSSSGSIGPVVSNVDMSAQVAAAYTAYSNNIAKPCTQTITTIDGKTVKTIVGVAGLNVICVKDISLSGTQVHIQGPAGAKFLFLISGKMVFTGGGSGPQIRVDSPIAPSDVLYNLIGTGSSVAFSGGGGGADCCAAIADGTILAPFRKIALSPGLVNGEIISSLDISIVSGSSVRCPSCQ
jgi:hypothetical protein